MFKLLHQHNKKDEGNVFYDFPFSFVIIYIKITLVISLHHTSFSVIEYRNMSTPTHIIYH